MLRTIQELEDKNQLSRHYQIMVDDEHMSDEDFDEISDALLDIEQHLIIVPNEWANHTMVEID